MPISVKAADVAQKFNAGTSSAVDRLVATEIGEVKQLLTEVLSTAERIIDDHFATMEDLKQPPYPTYDRHNRRWTASISFQFQPSAVTNRPDVFEKLRSKVSALITAAGFEGGVSVRSGVVSATLWDTQYQPINETNVANSLFEEGAKHRK